MNTARHEHANKELNSVDTSNHTAVTASLNLCDPHISSPKSVTTRIVDTSGKIPETMFSNLIDDEEGECYV